MYGQYWFCLLLFYHRLPTYCRFYIHFYPLHILDHLLVLFGRYRHIYYFIVTLILFLIILITSP